MSNLRFAIIRSMRTHIGNGYEDVVFEYQAEKVYNSLVEGLLGELPKKRILLKPGDVRDAFERAWAKAMDDFKQVTVRIL